MTPEELKDRIKIALRLKEFEQEQFFKDPEVLRAIEDHLLNPTKMNMEVFRRPMDYLWEFWTKIPQSVRTMWATTDRSDGERWGSKGWALANKLEDRLKDTEKQAAFVADMKAQKESDELEP